MDTAERLERDDGGPVVALALEGVRHCYARAGKFEATTNDPKFQDEYTRVDPDFVLAKRPELERLVNELAKVSPETLKYLEAELKKNGFGTGP